MAEEYKLPLKVLEDAGIEAKEGVSFSLRLSEGTIFNATITKVEKDSVIVTKRL